MGSGRCGALLPSRPRRRDLYLGAKPAFVPSLVDKTHYPATKEWAAGIGLQPTGYFQWAQRSLATVEERDK